MRNVQSVYEKRYLSSIISMGGRYEMPKHPGIRLIYVTIAIEKYMQDILFLKIGLAQATD